MYVIPVHAGMMGDTIHRDAGGPGFAGVRDVQTFRRQAAWMRSDSRFIEGAASLRSNPSLRLVLNSDSTAEARPT